MQVDEFLRASFERRHAGSKTKSGRPVTWDELEAFRKMDRAQRRALLESDPERESDLFATMAAEALNRGVLLKDGDRPPSGSDAEATGT